MIYLNQAATTYPKPNCVHKAVQAYLSDAPASQFRGNLRDQVDFMTKTRKNIGEILGTQNWEQIYFTSGATESANALLRGLDFKSKDILVTQTEHNSILRPLFNMDKFNPNQIKIVPCETDGMVTVEAIKNSLTKNSTAIIINHCSNVTGCIQNLENISRFAKEHGLFLLVDASQSAGCMPIHTDKLLLDAVIFTGHKGLLGLPGTGGFYIRDQKLLKPFIYGGTGRNSAQLLYKDDFEFEVGTQNMPGIAALCASTSYLLERGISAIQKEEQRLMQKLYEGLKALEHVVLYRDFDDRQGPVLSMNINGVKASDVGYILSEGYQITVRCGLHCSPLIHKAMHTLEDGTVRISISCMTTEEEIDAVIFAITQIVDSYYPIHS